MRINEQDLDKLLTRFTGYSVKGHGSSFKKICLGFFPSNVVPSFHADIPFDATSIQSNYKTYYQLSDSSFSVYIYYNLIQIMKREDFSFLRYRFINDNWYCFDNLPLFVSVKVNDPLIQQVNFFIEDVAGMSWSEFSHAYRLGIETHRKSKTSMVPPEGGWYGVSHLLTTLAFDFTGYIPSQKHNDFNAHAPWFVLSQKQMIDDKVHFTLSCTLSHASSLPSELDLFINTLKQALINVPDKQKITNYFTAVDVSRTLTLG